MLSIWEIVQGLAFMAVFGGITLLGFPSVPRTALSAPQTAPAAVRLPLPRVAAEEEHGSLPIG